MMIKSELIVIPKVGEASYEYHRSDVDKNHQDSLITYIMNNNINIDIYNDPFIYTLGLEMAYLDYILICTYGKHFNIYLPPDLTNAQAKWFYDRREELSEYNIMIINVDKEDNKKYEINFIEQCVPGLAPIDMLYKKIQEKTNQDEISKVKKYGNK